MSTLSCTKAAPHRTVRKTPFLRQFCHKKRSINLPRQARNKCRKQVVQKNAFYAGTITLLRSITAKAKQLGKKLLYQCHTTGGMDNNTVASFLIGAGVDHCACAHKTRWLRFGALDVTTYRQFTQTSSGWRLTNGRVFVLYAVKNRHCFRWLARCWQSPHLQPRSDPGPAARSTNSRRSVRRSNDDLVAFVCQRHESDVQCVLYAQPEGAVLSWHWYCLGPCEY